MGYTRNIIEKAKEKTVSLEKLSRKQLSQADTSGRNMFEKWTGFRQQMEGLRLQSVHLCDEQEIVRENHFQMQYELYDIDDSFGKVTSSARLDFQKLRRRKQERIKVTIMARLQEVKWFPLLIYRLKTYLRRVTTGAPSSCLKFIFALYHLISFQIEITVRVFHQILESKVFTKEDYHKNIVHQLIDVVRTTLSITPEDFLKYLESHGFQASPELLNLVRMNSQNIVQRKQRKYRASLAGAHSESSFDSASSSVSTALNNNHQPGDDMTINSRILDPHPEVDEESQVEETGDKSQVEVKTVIQDIPVLLVPAVQIESHAADPKEALLVVDDGS